DSKHSNGDKQGIGKNEEAEDVDVHLYRSMIGSLMYLTASRPDIMFAVCACARDSPFDLEAFSESDYARASLDRKSTAEDRVKTAKDKHIEVFGIELRGGLSCPNLMKRHAVHKELGDRMERVAATASSLEAEQDSGSGPRCQDTILGDVDVQTRFETTSKQFNDPPLSKVNTFGSREDSMQLMELMAHCTILCEFVRVKEKRDVVSQKQKERMYILLLLDEVSTVRLQVSTARPNLVLLEISIRSDLHLEDARGKDFSGRITPLFDTMMVQASEEVGEDSYHPTDSNQIPIVLDLEKAKSNQAIEIASLKKRVDKLEKRRKFKNTGLKRLKKFGAARKIESSNDILDDDEVFVDVTTVEKEEQSTKTGEAVTTAGVEDSAALTIRTTVEAVTTADVEDSAAPTIPTTVEETLAQTLMEIKVTKPKAKGIVFHDLEKHVSKPTVSVTQPSIKDKGKGIMQEPERPLIKKDQVTLDEDLARNILAQLDAEIIEEERLERQKQEEANIALIESWENTQAMMEADRLLAERLQTREREELTDEEKGKLFMELMEKRRKHFAALRAQEKRNRPPTKA
ncbi:hypothetical protein Tco_0098294, partial [Tanacetum coccineum]